MSIVEIIAALRVQDHPYVVIEQCAALALCDEVQRLQAKLERAQSRALPERDGFPLVLYFGSKEDKDAFIELIKKNQPGMVEHRVPYSPNI